MSINEFQIKSHIKIEAEFLNDINNLDPHCEVGVSTELGLSVLEFDRDTYLLRDQRQYLDGVQVHSALG